MIKLQMLTKFHLVENDLNHINALEISRASVKMHLKYYKTLHLSYKTYNLIKQKYFVLTHL